MKLYLMRHCESEDGPRDDPTRQLTSVGRKQAQTMGQFLVRQIGRVDVVLTSYFARAQGTAAPIAELLGCSSIIDTPALQPETAPKDAWKEIKFLSDGCEDVLVVSHHPLVNELLKLLTGCDSEKFHHGAIAHIGDDGKLHWFVPPAVVERDEDDVLEAAAGVVEALEAYLQEAKGDGGLKHPRHQAVLSKVRAKVKKVMAGYFDRQGAAVLKAVKPNIEALLLSHPQLKEAGGEWVTINGHPVLIGGSISDRVERAKNSAVRTGQHEQAIADRSEAVLSKGVGVPRTADNSAFDLRNDNVGIEVKTLVNGKNEKITMSKDALGRKLAEQRADELKAYTVVVDRRTGGLTGKATYYVKEGLGSFRLGSMTKISLGDLKDMVKP
jgi:phosphohistidine phosphatase